MFGFVAVRDGALDELAGVNFSSNRAMLRLEMSWWAMKTLGRVRAARQSSARASAGEAAQRPLPRHGIGLKVHAAGEAAQRKALRAILVMSEPKLRPPKGTALFGTAKAVP
jgi:hypothetical protein